MTYDTANVVERVVTLREGEDAPRGWVIHRLLGTAQQPTGSGTEYVVVHIVAIRQAGGGPATLTGVVNPRPE